MSFLQPLLLLAMPLIGLPILIHLLNQRRHKTAPWAARQFVLQATNMGRGMANVRHWVVLALRSLAIAALIFAIARPLASRIPGLGFLGSQRTQMIVMDRSPSMAIRNSSSGLTWRESALNQLQDHLQNVGGQQILFHSLTDEPVVVGRTNLLEMLETVTTDTQSNIPELIERTLKHVSQQAVGPADIWVCTDHQASDWRLDSGRWSRIREQLQQSPEVKLHILTPEALDEFNLAISTSNVKLTRSGDRHFVSLDFSVQQTSGPIEQRTVPVQIELAGTSHDVEIEMVAGDYRYQQLKIELPPQQASEAFVGGGVVRLPHDSNERDNQYFFSFAPQPARSTVVVSDDPEISELMNLVCSTPFDSQQKFSCTVLPADGYAEIDWEKTALLVWHAPLPSGDVADRLQTFIAAGGNVVFLPVEAAGAQPELLGVRWGEWEAKSVAIGAENKPNDRTTPILNARLNNSEGRGQNSAESTAFQVAQWRTEDDLLATDESGRVLPLGSIACDRRCDIRSDSAATLATFADGQPLLVRAITESGGAYFLATTPDEATSTFTDDGIVLYVMMHRAIEQGAASLAANKQLETGDVSLADTERWQPLGLNVNLVAEDQRAFFAGAYQSDNQVIAINRPVSEDTTNSIDETAVAEVLGNDAFNLIQTSADSLSGLTNELWKLFVIGMIMALIAEGWFSLPAKKKPSVLESRAIV